MLPARAAAAVAASPPHACHQRPSPLLPRAVRLAAAAAAAASQYPGAGHGAGKVFCITRKKFSRATPGTARHETTKAATATADAVHCRSRHHWLTDERLPPPHRQRQRATQQQLRDLALAS